MRAFFCALTVLTLSSHSPRSEARSFKEIQKSGKILVATNGTFAPFSFYQGTKLSGFEVELAEALAQELKVKAEWKVIPFDSTLIGLQQDRYDFVIVSHGITDERKKIVNFTLPYYCTGAVILSKAGGPQTATDLKDKTIGTQVGTTYYHHLKKLNLSKDIKTFKSETDTFLALNSGRIAAMVGDKFAALATQKSRPEAKLQIGEMLFVEHIGMAVQKGNADLLQAINEALKAVQKSGTYTKISEKYFQEDIRCKP